MIAIMQPYFYPYYGYLELIRRSDYLVLLDDVYCSKKWINRNVFGNHLLTIPINKLTRKLPINQIKISYDYDWVKKTINFFQHTYTKEQRNNVLYQDLLNIISTKPVLLFEVLQQSLESIISYFELPTKLINSSSLNIVSRGSGRIIEVCKTLGQYDYINLPNGRDLYDEHYFSQHQIKINFLDTKNFPRTSLLHEELIKSK